MNPMNQPFGKKPPPVLKDGVDGCEGPGKCPHCDAIQEAVVEAINKFMAIMKEADEKEGKDSIFLTAATTTAMNITAAVSMNGSGGLDEHPKLKPILDGMLLLAKVQLIACHRARAADVNGKGSANEL